MNLLRLGDLDPSEKSERRVLFVVPLSVAQFSLRRISGLGEGLGLGEGDGGGERDLKARIFLGFKENLTRVSETGDGDGGLFCLGARGERLVLSFVLASALLICSTKSFDKAIWSLPISDIFVKIPCTLSQN